MTLAQFFMIYGIDATNSEMFHACRTASRMFFPPNGEQDDFLFIFGDDSRIRAVKHPGVGWTFERVDSDPVQSAPLQVA